jgi:hypothetical protein
LEVWLHHGDASVVDEDVGPSFTTLVDDCASLDEHGGE